MSSHSQEYTHEHTTAHIIDVTSTMTHTLHKHYAPACLPEVYVSPTTFWINCCPCYFEWAGGLMSPAWHTDTDGGWDMFVLN